MDNVKKHLDNAFKILSTMYVNQDNVDIVAAVRAELRQAYAAAMETEEVTEDGNG